MTTSNIALTNTAYTAVAGPGAVGATLSFSRPCQVVFSATLPAASAVGHHIEPVFSIPLTTMGSGIYCWAKVEVEPVAQAVVTPQADAQILNGTGGGSGSGGDASAANQTAVQANAGSDASKATAIQGIASGKPVPVSTSSAAVSATPTVTASSAYTANNEVGGLLTFASIVGTPGSGVLQSIRVSSKTVQTATFKLYIFNANPSNTTWTDKTAPSINVADIPSLIGVYTLSTADSGLGPHTIYNLDAIGKSFSIASGSTLYGILVTTGTPTFGSTSDISVTINVLKD